ncbi:MAG: O-antigen ligase family protein [Solirubrobacterales bacterium]
MALSTMATALVFAAAAGLALYRSPPPPIPMILVAGLGAMALLALVVTRYDLAVGLAFVGLGVVKFEPAPVDLLVATLILVAVATGRVNLRRIPLTAAGALAAFLLLNVVSMVDAISPGQAAFFFALTLYGAMLAFWLAGYIDSPRRARMIVRCYLVAAVGTTVISLLALAVPFPGHEDLIYGADRLQGLFKDPNVYAPFLVPIALILLEEIITPRLLAVRKSLKGLMLSLLIVGVLLAGSRAAWLSLGLGVAVLLAVVSLRRGGATRGFAALAVVAFGLGGATVVVVATGNSSLLGERAEVQAYDSERFNTQAESINVAQEHPIGLGPGQFDVYSPTAVHSLYLRALVEQGILGMAAMLAFLVATLVLALRNAAEGRDTMGIGSAALLGAWIGLLANSVVIDSMHWRHLWVLTALIWAGYMHRAVRSRAPRSAALT